MVTSLDKSNNNFITVLSKSNILRHSLFFFNLTKSYLPIQISHNHLLIVYIVPHSIHDR